MIDQSTLVLVSFGMKIEKQCYNISLNETKFTSTTTLLLVDPIHKLKIAPD